jgi:hypothetical protein
MTEEPKGKFTCAKCSYWDSSEGALNTETGVCRRHAPTNGGIAAWPITEADDFCGEGS